MINVYRVQNGESAIIGSKKLLNIELNKWYNVKLVGKRNRFSIYVVYERDYAAKSKYDNLPDA